MMWLCFWDFVDHPQWRYVLIDPNYTMYTKNLYLLLLLLLCFFFGGITFSCEWVYKYYYDPNLLYFFYCPKPYLLTGLLICICMLALAHPLFYGIIHEIHAKHETSLECYASWQLYDEQLSWMNHIWMKNWHYMQHCKSIMPNLLFSKGWQTIVGLYLTLMTQHGWFTISIEQVKIELVTLHKIF